MNLWQKGFLCDVMRDIMTSHTRKDEVHMNRNCSIIPGLRWRVCAAIPACATAALLAATLPANSASAEEYMVASAGEEAASVIEKADAEYREARTACVKMSAKAFCLAQRANVLEDLLPAQQERSDDAARALYKQQSSHYTTIDMLLDSQSLDEFIAQTEYIDRITRANAEEVKRSKELEERVDAARSEVEAVRAESEAKMQEANASLEAVYEIRTLRQREGIAKAQAEASRGVSVSSTSSSSKNSKESSSKSSEKEESDSAETLTGDASGLDDGANWHATEDEFVAEWAPRLDAYLEGSPLAGQGKNFAKSAWKYCIDPRWSASISTIESGKGSICIRPHNAWGWGAADSNPAALAAEWPSWEAAIDAHARGLSKGYGYTITMSGARTYCPPNWLKWYNITLSEMSSI